LKNEYMAAYQVPFVRLELTLAEQMSWLEYRWLYHISLAGNMKPNGLIRRVMQEGMFTLDPAHVHGRTQRWPFKEEDRDERRGVASAGYQDPVDTWRHFVERVEIYLSGFPKRVTPTEVAEQLALTQLQRAVERNDDVPPEKYDGFMLENWSGIERWRLDQALGIQEAESVADLPF
jgi:hypothetical protein